MFAVTATYFLWADAHDGIHHAHKNVVDEVVLGSTRRIGRLTIAYAERLIPSRISSWLAIIMGRDRLGRVFPTVSSKVQVIKDTVYRR